MTKNLITYNDKIWLPIFPLQGAVVEKVTKFFAKKKKMWTKNSELTKQHNGGSVYSEL